MGKNLREKHSGISSSNEDGAGCTWGLLHIIKYHHWRHVKNKITHKRRPILGNHVNVPSADKIQEQNDEQMGESIVEEKSTKSSLGKNNSVKARIKSFLAEEMYKKKGRHHRSSSHPVRSQLTRTDSIHHLEHIDLDPLAEMLILDYQSPRSVYESHDITSAAYEMDSVPIEPLTDCEGCGECSTMVVDERQNKSFETHTIFQGDLNDTKEYMLKQKLDALNIISVNKELLVKFLHDPGSPLAHHFRNQQAFSAKRGLVKSETFPSTSSPRKRGFEPSSLKQMQVADSKAEGISKLREAMGESSHIPSPATAKHRKHVVIKHFKDLKQKIKHVIREGRKERHIITMDAIIHKIPHGQKMEKEIENQSRKYVTYGEGKDIPGSRYETDCFIPSLIRNKLWLRHMRRASSLNESLDRYCQLYETSFKREAKHHTSEGLRMRAKEGGSPRTSVPKYLARIYSLPDLNLFLYQNEESPEAFSSAVPTKSVVDRSVDEQKNLHFPIGSEDQLQIDAPTDGIIQETSVELGEINSVTGDEAALTSLPNNEEKSQLGSHMKDYGSLKAEEAEAESKIKPVLLDELAKLDKQGEEEVGMVTPELSETEILEKLEDGKLICDTSHLQVDSKDKAEFSYVRDVLELSGFSGNSFLGTWHSDDQPVDPLVYEEVEGCLVFDPDCCGNEGGKCDHLLLFDLINEVLLEIYARSYSYCPLPLSYLSHISPMPAGPHVLKEVWGLISWYLSLRPEVDQSLDCVMVSDLAKSSYGWMNLQFDTECVGIELEDLIFDDLLEELIWA